MFTHAPLDPDSREIRVVRLRYPVVDDVIEKNVLQLSLEIRHVSLDDSDTLYTALSYVWGNATDTRPIQINDQPFSITVNLYAALCQFRRANLDRWLWIDAICIDQLNNGERSHQVNMMDGIFGRAELVLMWLGPGTRETDVAMEIFSYQAPRIIASRIFELVAGLVQQTRSNEMVQYFQTADSDPLSTSAKKLYTKFLPWLDLHDYLEAVHLESPRYPNFRPWLHLRRLLYIMSCRFRSEIALGQDFDHTSFTAGVLKILQMDYWHRIWIVQEVVLARKAVVVVGTKHMLLDDFDAVLFTFPAVMRQAFMSLPKDLFKIKSLAIRRTRRWASDISLLDILWETSPIAERPQYSATDNRDIVFGLLGLRHQETQALLADYSQSLAEVFARITRLLLSFSTYSLSLVVIKDSTGNAISPWPINHPHASYMGNERPDTWFPGSTGCLALSSIIPGDINGALPTWVPDWTDIGKHGITLWPVEHFCMADAVAGHSQKTQTIPNSPSEALILRLYGCQVDEVTAVMDQPLGPGDPQRDPFLGDEGSWFRSIISFAGLGPDHTQAEDYVWRTMRYGKRDKSIDGEQQVAGLAKLYRKIMRMESIEADTLTPKQVNYVWERLYGMVPRNRDLTEVDMQSFGTDCRGELVSNMRGRTLFKTRKGRLGIGYICIKTGDVVTLIWGVRTPIILRGRGEGGFYFRGDSYVYGMMKEGKYLENTASEEEFILY